MSCPHWERSAGRIGPRIQSTTPIPTIATPAAAAITRQRFEPRWTSSMVLRASAMLCSRRRASFCRHCRSSSRTFAGVFAGRVCKSGSRSSTAAIVS